MSFIGRYLENNVYYLGAIDNDIAWVSVDAAEDFTKFILYRDEKGKYFMDFNEKVYVEFS